MRLTRLSGTLLFTFLATTVSPLKAQPAKDADTGRINALVLQLGDDKFAKRESARKELEIIGEKALPALRSMALGSKDFDLDTRAKQLVRTILLGCRNSKSIGLATALIDPGEFQMGSPRAEQGRRADESQHEIRITKPFLIGMYEVTQEEYQKVMKVNPSWFSKTGGGKDKVKQFDTSRFPVERVSWFDAVEFCNRLSKLDGYSPYYKMSGAKVDEDSIKEAAVTIVGGNGYRLPNEAEWEFVCRAGTTTPFHYGRVSTGVESNVKAVPPTGYAAPPRVPDLERTTKVGSYKPNRWGVYDMHGNAGEWCEDWYDREYYDKSPKDDPKGPEKGTHRMLRGGSWLVSNGSCRSASRFFHTPNEATYYTGFRVARTP